MIPKIGRYYEYKSDNKDIMIFMRIYANIHLLLLYHGILELEIPEGELYIFEVIKKFDDDETKFKSGDIFVLSKTLDNLNNLKEVKGNQLKFLLL